MNCQFCAKEYKEENYPNKKCSASTALKSHEHLCVNNPNRRILSPESAERIRQSSIERFRDPEYRKKHTDKMIAISSSPEYRDRQSKASKERYKDPKYREKFSQRMKQVVLDNPESYSDKNVVGRSKHFTVDGVRYNSSWEYEVSKYLDSQNLRWQRSKLEPETYLFENSWHLYFPDFLLLDYNMYIEVKGYETEKDKAKISHSKKPVILIKQKDIDLIKKGEYDIHQLIRVSQRSSDASS